MEFDSLNVFPDFVWVNPREVFPRELIDLEDEVNYPSWKEPDFLEFLFDKGCFAYLVKAGIKVVGYYAYRLNTDSIEIVKFCFKQLAHTEQIKHQTMKHIKGKLRVNRRKSILLNLREDDSIMAFFLKTEDFTSRLLKNHFPKMVGVVGGTNQDAYQFEYSLKV